MSSEAPPPAQRSARRRKASVRLDEAFRVDRLPPHSPEAEQGVLGCILLSPQPCLSESMELLKANPDVFYDLRHREIYRTLMRMLEAQQPIDVITLQQRLKDTQPVDDQGRPKDGNLLELVGGIAYLATLPDAVPSAANLAYYANIVYEKFILRQFIQTCTHVIGRLYEYEGEVNQLCDEVERDILRITEARAESGPKPLKAFGERMQHRLDHYARGIGMITGLPTGFRYWDRMNGGMHAADIIILGGDPAAGKTSLAMNVAERVALDGGNPVGVISLEMSAEDLIMRLACSRVRVNFHKIRTGCPKQQDLEKLAAIFPKVMTAPIILDDTGGLSVHEVRSRLRNMKNRHGIKLAIVDYLQLISLTREQMFLGAASGYADVARGLQQAAKELQIPIIVISQLSNEGRKRKKNQRPVLTDFRETGAIGDVANFAGILWRPELDAEEETKLREAIAKDPMGNHVLPVQMEVLKNKNGPSGMGMQFDFLRWCMRFEDVQQPSKEEDLLGAAPAATGPTLIDPEDVPPAREGAELC